MHLHVTLHETEQREMPDHPVRWKQYSRLLLLILLAGCNSTDSTVFYNLTVTPQPPEGGSTEPSGGEFKAGSDLEIFAYPSEGWDFAGWEGDASGRENPVVVTLEKESRIIARFEPMKFEEQTLLFRLFNPVLESPAAGIHVTLADEEGTVLGDGETTEEGEYLFAHSSPEGEIRSMEARFTGTGYFDFTEIMQNDRSREVEFLIHPVPVHMESTLPPLTAGDSVEIDFRDYMHSLDPDDEQPVPIDSVIVTGASRVGAPEADLPAEKQLELERLDAWSYRFAAGEEAEEGDFELIVTAYTPTNRVEDEVLLPLLRRADDPDDLDDPDNRGEPGDPGDPDDPGGPGNPVDPDKETHLVIMPLGDSLTNDPRSRVTLWNLLVEEGFTVDYVGDQRQTSGIPDPDHEGVGGITIEGVRQKAGQLMTRHKPRIINLLIGTNDIAWYFAETPDETADRWDQLVESLFQHSEPETWIIAATLPPMSSSLVGKEGVPNRDRAVQTERFNEAVRKRVESRRESGERIILADMEAAMDPAEHLSGDGVHLNEAGYRVMGTVYYEAILKIKVPQ